MVHPQLRKVSFAVRILGHVEALNLLQGADCPFSISNLIPLVGFGLQVVSYNVVDFFRYDRGCAAKARLIKILIRTDLRFHLGTVVCEVGVLFLASPP
jgi:hypothetical protein